MENKIIMRLERHPEDPGKRWPKRLALTKVLISGNFKRIKNLLKNPSLLGI